MGRKAGKTKAKGGPQRYRQSCPGGSSSFPIERAASQHAPPKQMRAPAISISTSHKMISLWGKLSTNSNRTKRQASPIFRMARPNSLPGLPLSPAPIQAPKAMMAKAPKRCRKHCPAYLPVKDEARSLVLPLRSGTAVPQESGGELRETGQRDNGCPDTAIPEKGVQENTPQSSWESCGGRKTKSSLRAVQRCRQSHGVFSTPCLFRRAASQHAPPKQKTPPAISICSTQANSP